jgi:hypothetical protein
VDWEVHATADQPPTSKDRSLGTPARRLALPVFSTAGNLEPNKRFTLYEQEKCSKSGRVPILRGFAKKGENPRHYPAITEPASMAGI